MSVDKNFWEKLYPTTKLWFALGIIILIFSATNYWLSAVVFLLFLGSIVKNGMIKQFKFAIIAICILGCSLFTIQGLFNPQNTTVLFTIVPGTFLVIYKEGIIAAANLYCRIVPLVACLYLMIRTTNMTDLGVALNKAGVSYKFNYVLITTFQIIPVFQKDMNQILNAQKARGLKTNGSLISRFKSFIPIIVPLISNSVAKVQSKAMALESKGFNSPNKKTYYRVVERGRQDAAIMVTAVVLVIAGITYRCLIWIKIL